MIFPKVNEASLNKGSFFHIYENEDFELYNILSQKEVIENQIICHPIIYKSIFKHAFFASNDFQRMEITDCIFENCDFSGCILTKSMLHRVKFVNCKLTGTKLMESYIGNTLFENCKMDYVNLSGSNIKESNFEHSVLSSADFVDCSLTKTMFYTND
ncbi:pentapeptide repeat-containing protein, partial [Enterococcus faecium]